MVYNMTPIVDELKRSLDASNYETITVSSARPMILHAQNFAQAKHVDVCRF